MTNESCEGMGEVMAGMMGQMTSGMNGGMMAGAIPWFALAILAVVLVVGLALALAVAKGRRGDDPREILRYRFARGEMSADEFVEARTTLG